MSLLRQDDWLLSWGTLALKVRMRIFSEGGREGQKGGRQRRRKRGQEGIKGLLVSCWAGWVAFDLWRRAQIRASVPFFWNAQVAHKTLKCMDYKHMWMKMGLWPAALETCITQGNRKLDLSNQGQKLSPGSPMGSCQIQWAAHIFAGSTILWGFGKTSHLRGERGQGKPCMEKRTFSSRVPYKAWGHYLLSQPNIKLHSLSP